LLRRFEAAAATRFTCLKMPPTRAAVRRRRRAVRADRQGQSERVIYAGTYSKPFATGRARGLRPDAEPVFTTVMRIKGTTTSARRTAAAVTAQALSSGRYEKHLAALRRRYAHKACLMPRRP